MNKKNIFLSIIYSVVLFIFFLGCKTTVDPPEHLFLKGSVQFNSPDNSTPDNVFIWFDGLELLNTNTDINGNFVLQSDDVLRGAQGNPINDSHYLYYFLGNYRLERDLIPIQEGKFMWGSTDHGIDGQGNLDKKLMQKLLNISTSIEPDTVDENYTGDIEIKISLENVSDTDIDIDIEIETYQKDDSSWASIILFNSENSIADAVLYRDSLSILQTQSISDLKEEKIIINVNDINLTAGSYEIIPYIRILQDGLPDDLYNQFGENADSFHSDYLNIPFKREVATLTVTEYIYSELQKDQKQRP